MISSKDYLILAALKMICEIIVENPSFGHEHTQKAEEMVKYLTLQIEEEFGEW